MSAAAQTDGFGYSSFAPPAPPSLFGTLFDPQGEHQAVRPQLTVRPLASAVPGAPERPAWTPGEPKVADPAPTPTAFCVRLCDGRYFPLTTTATALTPARMCSAFCPASRTKVFEGASIEAAAAPDGARYAKLPTAFLYRSELVDGCTCNGRDAVGLAKIDLAADPTLQVGDIVATADGLKVFRGGMSARHRAADFTPIRRSGLVSDDLRRKLRSIQVAKEMKQPARRL